MELILLIQAAARFVKSSPQAPGAKAPTRLSGPPPTQYRCSSDPFPAWLDELRARTLLSAVIAPSVKLIKAGREYKACCPFHSEKTPSFTVNDEKGFYHCFGCGAHGDAIRFLTDARGLPFMDAVKELAGQGRHGGPRRRPAGRGRRPSARPACTKSWTPRSAWFIEQLDGIDGGAGARLSQGTRHFRRDEDASFGFGFAPDSRGKLKTALESFGERQAGRGRHADPARGGQGALRPLPRPADIPIRDARGRVHRLLRRASSGHGEPKYLNSPGHAACSTRAAPCTTSTSPARPAAPPSASSSSRARWTSSPSTAPASREVVAPNGTALTEAQLERMWRLDPAPICCFDGDSAGQKAAIRAATRALPHLGPERTLRFVALARRPGPRRCRPQGRQARRSRRCSPSAEPLVERLWRHEVEAAPLDTPEARAGLRQRLLDHAPAIGDPNAPPALPRRMARPLRQASSARSSAERRPLRPAAASGTSKTAASPRPRPRPARRRAPSAAPASTAPTARALLAGFCSIPRGAARPCRAAWRTCPSPTARTARAARPAGRFGDDRRRA